MDTATKRHSGLGQRFARLPFGRRFAILRPDGTIDGGDRQTLGFAYGGIDAGVLVYGAPHVVASQIYHPGVKATQVYHPGVKATQVVEQ